MKQLDDARWRAVETRDEAVAGVFVYAVRTTNVYCRPGCAARRPLRRNVEFFLTPADAAAQGYRACQRCRPNEARAHEPAVVAVIAVCRELERPDARSVTQVARDAGFSERQLRRMFTDVVGVSMSDYRRAHRAARTRAALREGTSVTNAVIESGYGSFRGFYEHAGTQLGMTPGRYRDGARGEHLRYTTIATPIGVVIAACTARGVCAVRVGSDEAVLEENVAAEFPHATLERDDVGLVEVSRVLARAVRGEDDATRLPLDVAGTAFQIRVWEALRRIPRGETRSYSQVADDIGAPTAVRAVASACAANHAALAIPCHRVLRRDGTLGGYRWGVGAKAALLCAEESGAAESQSR
ncbi:MAG TPA: methylated-DNA--[protein]-cysteine S-methyltransferase [Acidimicrobiales bacterium]|nr:methylated-DNA--[protein]-cysteine S-methyltransferase [Acidimicrobiales bacterium]